MKTQIFKNRAEFLKREDKEINGVSEAFAKNHPDFEEDNETNKGCWNCSDCSDCFSCFSCSRCSDCYYCSDCSDCYYCSGCSDCYYCSGCFSCSDCSDCSDCFSCSRCSDCYYCSGCSDCSDCYYCSGCSDCSDKKGKFKIPNIENLNKKVLQAISVDDALNMKNWHTCGTTHCWAGWIVHLAGKEGYALEKETSTLFAAMMIYKKSNGKSISPCNFFISNEEAKIKIKELANK